MQKLTNRKDILAAVITAAVSIAAVLTIHLVKVQSAELYL